MDFDTHLPKKRRLESPEYFDRGSATASAQTPWDGWNRSDLVQMDVSSSFYTGLEENSFTDDQGHQVTRAGDDGRSAGSDEFWCFGTVQDLQGTCKFPIIEAQTYSIAVDRDGSFHGLDNGLPKGTVSADTSYVITSLLDEPELTLDVTCRKDDAAAQKQPRSSQANGAVSSSKCLINITLYGPSSLFEDVGSFFEDYDRHLQDPESCKYIVPYHNPHKLPRSDGGVAWTSELVKRVAASLFIEDQRGADLLDELTSQQDLAEAAQPPSIRSTLQRHQLQALTFMLQREQGWAWDGSRADIWELCEDGTDPYFMNRISNAVETDEPPQFYGGIIADPMGLGKTLSMISLIAYDAVASGISGPPTGLNAVESSDQTLIVVPPPLLIEWERQFKEHIMPGSLPWDHHYGKHRLSTTDLQSTLIVLTTYHTVSHEWKSKDSRATSILFKTRWKRVIIDEAHFIRNPDSLMAKSICDINAVARWAVTGTPIQNKLADLATLLQFLHVHPYSEKKVFENDISNVWKSDGSKEAVRRLQRLAGCLILRRPKATINLPARQNIQFAVNLALPERQLYEVIRKQTKAQIEEAMRKSPGTMTNYTSMLQRIEALRMVCNLGLYYHSRKQILELCQPEVNSRAVPWEQVAQRVFDGRREMDVVRCRVCTYPVDAIDMNTEQLGTGKSLFSRCWEYVCSHCTDSFPGVWDCTHTPSCPVAVVSTDVGLSSGSSASLPWYSAASTVLPTKVSLLVQDLCAQNGTKCVVFSTWRTTLDLIETGLRDASIPFVRFDGKVAQKDRQSVIDRFRTDPAVKVIMLTLACGATGLTLTEATRVYLMEPNWNPTVEDQALARIHRIGQTKAVTTVRFIVQDSFERRVVELQKTKRDLAAVLLGRHSGETGGSGSSSSQLELLRRLV